MSVIIFDIDSISDEFNFDESFIRFQFKFRNIESKRDQKSIQKHVIFQKIKFKKMCRIRT